MFRIHVSTIPLALLAFGICTGSLQATGSSLVASPASITLTCDTVLGPNPVTVGIVLASGATAGNVTVTATAGTAATTAIVLPSPAVQNVSSTTVPTNFTFNMAAGCKGVTAATSLTLTFTLVGGATPLTVATAMGAITTASGTALAPSPSSVILSCTKSGTTYSAGSAQTLNVTSPANLGTPFTINTTAGTINGTAETALPSWLTVTPTTGGTASSNPVALTITPVGGSTGTGCGALPVGSTTYNLHLLNAPAADKVIPITIQVGGSGTLTALPASTSLSYVKGSLAYTAGTPNVITSTPASFFTVDPSTLPLWLNVTPTTGTAPTTGSSVSLTFIPTAGAETLALGSYTANVHLKVSGELDTIIPVTLQVKDPAASLTVAEGITRNLSWTLGQALPTLSITPVSSDSPIAYAITTSAGTLSPQLVATNGIAYSFGSAPIPVTFLQSVFGAAAPGATLTGTVIFTPTNGSTPVVVTINVQVKSPGATLSAIAPSSLPTSTSGSFTVVISGSGFVSTGGSTLVTKAGIVSNGSIVSDFFVTPTVINSTSISLAIIVPSSNDPYLPFSGTGGTVVFGVCNPGGGNCSAPTSSVSLTIGVNPILQAVTSASSYMQATAPALTSVSAYDILSIFGTNFCVSGGAGCIAPSPTILYGVTDPVTSRYLASLSPDATGATQRNLSVTFQTHASSPVAIGTAPLLFATNSQINLLVPDAVKAFIGNTVDIVVSFGYGNTSTTMFKSAPFSITIAATDPGVFTVGGDGQGDAAALLPSYGLITQTTPAGARLSTDSDIISLYVTGLGVPDSVTGVAAWGSTKCMAVADYWAAVNAADAPTTALTSSDGLVIQSALFPSSNIQPCLKSSGADVPSVTIGGVPATVSFAGWVSGSVAGLYQINVQVPVSSSSFVDASGSTGHAGSTPLHLPVVVTTNTTKTSQPTGVNVWVVGSLMVTATGPVTVANGSPLTGLSIAASDGTSAYTYAVTTGTLPAGLTLNADGTITGTPSAAGTSTVVFTATDSVGLTGTISITFVIT
jgi:large repetitive protein